VPKYDYQCDDCKQTYEVSQRISEAPLTTCRHCGGHIRRLIGAASFILKGGGWYVTDYPSESRKKAMSAEKKSAEPAAAAKPSEGKSSPSEGKSTEGGSGSTPASPPAESSSTKS
jgi:putative FmdB family regulatory protein